MLLLTLRSGLRCAVAECPTGLGCGCSRAAPSVRLFSSVASQTSLKGLVPRSSVQSVAPTGVVSQRLPSQLSSLVRHLSSSASLNDAWSDHKDVTYDELKPLTEQPTGEVTLIDVREPAETQEGMIPSAVNLPLSELKEGVQMVSDQPIHAFVEKFGFDPPKREDHIIVYCRSGKRSQQAADYLASHGFKNIRNYRGSWLDWTDHKAKGQ